MFECLFIKVLDSFLGAINQEETLGPSPNTEKTAKFR